MIPYTDEFVDALLLALRESSDPIGIAMQTHRLQELMGVLGCTNPPAAAAFLTEIAITSSIGHTTTHHCKDTHEKYHER